MGVVLKLKVDKSIRKLYKKKLFCGRPGQDFFCHPHFRKQGYIFLWPNYNDLFSDKFWFYLNLAFRIKLL